MRGDNNEVTSVGSGNRARVVGDTNSVTLASENGVTKVSVVGDVNDATALATGRSRASITMRSDLSSAAATADDGSAARIRMLGD